MSGKRPDISIKYKSPEGKYFEVGGIWLNDFGGGNLTPVTEDKDGDYPKMSLAKALKMVNEKKGFLNLFANTGKGSRIAVTGGASEEF